MKVSCIVPVYNVEKYLKKCIDSILNQTFKEFELILVDDGSKDSCPNICDDYKTKDIRVNVIHKKNGGLSEARNYGLDTAKGDFIIFVDSDDYIENTMFETLYNLNIKYSTKISACDKAFVYEKNYKIEYGKESNTESVFDSEKAFSVMVDFYKKLGMEMWNKMYARELFDNVRFPVGKLFEDQATQYKLIFQVEKISYIEKSLYFYLRRNNSITTQKYNEKEKQRLEMVNEMVNYIKNYHFNIVSNVIKYKILSCNFTIVNKMIKSNDFDYEFLKLVRQDTKYYSKFLNNKDLCMVRKIQMYLLIYLWPIYKIIYKVMYGKKDY